MEDVKERGQGKDLDAPGLCFNPCFNGRCKRTTYNIPVPSTSSICFNPCFNGRCKRTNDAEYLTALKRQFQSLF